MASSTCGGHVVVTDVSAEGNMGPILPERDHGFDLRKREFAAPDRPR
jgi:hypothetical protein